MIRIPQITIPRQPRPGLDLLPWCRDVNYAIKQIASIKEDFLGSGSGSSGNLITTRTPTHPWKVTDAGSGNAAINTGYILGYYFRYTNDSPGSPTSGPNMSFPPEDIVLAPGAYYDGGTVAITGTQYIYAEIPRNGMTKVYAETEGTGSNAIVEIELGDEIEPSTYTDGDPTDVPVIFASSLDPSSYVPTTDYAAICIAKVINTSGVLTITQYVTHNPTVFVPVLSSIVGDP